MENSLQRSKSKNSEIFRDHNASNYSKESLNKDLSHHLMKQFSTNEINDRLRKIEKLLEKR